MALDNSNNTYTVQEGDTLSGLFGEDWQEVAALNSITNPRNLQVGQVLQLNPEPEVEGEEGFLTGAADWASDFFGGIQDSAREFGGDVRDAYEDLSVSSIGDDVYSSLVNSPMPTSLEELGSTEEGSEEGIGTLEDYEDVTIGEWGDTNNIKEETQASEAPTEQWHVQKGDTLSSIAKTLGTSVEALLKSNQRPKQY